MRKIVIHCTTSTVGTDSWEFILVNTNLSNQELDSLAEEYALCNAEMYDIYPPDYENYQDHETADEDICGIWADYIPEKHDMYSHSGTPRWS